MAKKSKEKQTTKKDKRRGGVRREERRFVPQSATSPALVRTLGALSAFLLGAGLWGYFYAQTFADDEKLKPVPAYLIAAGAVILGITIWVGTSSESPIRVGDPGISVEKGELRRMPWWGVEKITFEPGTLALVITGKDESGLDWTFKVSVKSHPEGVGWLVKEALDRIPRRVDIPDETLEKLPAAAEHAGQKLTLEPLQVVGKKDAITGKTISYEPDARVCPRCERVYYKRSVPKKCKCGNSLVHLRPSDADDEDDANDADEQIDDGRTSSERLEAASSKKVAAAGEAAES
jgi:hypothetical protein